MNRINLFLCATHGCAFPGMGGAAAPANAPNPAKERATDDRIRTRRVSRLTWARSSWQGAIIRIISEPHNKGIKPGRPVHPGVVKTPARRGWGCRGALLRPRRHGGARRPKLAPPAHTASSPTAPHETRCPPLPARSPPPRPGAPPRCAGPPPPWAAFGGVIY
jgi:hypothetical protein